MQFGEVGKYRSGPHGKEFLLQFVRVYRKGITSKSGCAEFFDKKSVCDVVGGVRSFLQGCGRYCGHTIFCYDKIVMIVRRNKALDT